MQPQWAGGEHQQKREGGGDDACTDSGSSVQLGGAQPAGLMMGAVSGVARCVERLRAFEACLLLLLLLLHLQQDPAFY